jgi:hypothetical protein
MVTNKAQGKINDMNHISQISIKQKAAI